MHNKKSVHLLWKEYTGAALGRRLMFPDYSHGCICLPTETGTILGIDEYSGKVKWRFRLPDSQKTNLIIANGKSFIFSTFDERTTTPSGSKSKLYKLNHLDGAVEWSYEFLVHSVSAPVIEDEQIFMFGADHVLYRFSLVSKQLISKMMTHKAQWTIYPPAAVNGCVIVPGGPGFAHNSHSIAFQKDQYAWDFPSGSYYSPGISGGTVFLISGMHTLHFIDLETGIEKGFVEADKAFTTQPICRNDLIYVGVRERNHGNAIYCYKSESRQLLWRYPILAGVTFPPILDKNRLIVLDNKSNLYVWNIHDHELLVRYEIGVRITVVPIIRDDKLFLIDVEGNLYAFILI